jgi:hypothetical protein
MMKKLLLPFVLIILLSTVTKGQSIQDNPKYLKLMNQLWGMTNAFALVHHEYDKQSENINETREEQLKVIEKLLSCSKNNLAVLKTEVADNTVLEKMEKNIGSLEKCYSDLKGDEWRSKPMWQMIYSIIRMRLEEATLNTLCDVG